MLHSISEKEKRNKLVIFKKCAHPLKEQALYVFPCYTGRFIKLHLGKRLQLAFKIHVCKSYGFGIILEAFKKKIKITTQLFLVILLEKSTFVLSS